MIGTSHAGLTQDSRKLQKHATESTVKDFFRKAFHFDTMSQTGSAASIPQQPMSIAPLPPFKTNCIALEQILVALQKKAAPKEDVTAATVHGLDETTEEGCKKMMMLRRRFIGLFLWPAILSDIPVASDFV